MRKSAEVIPFTTRANLATSLGVTLTDKALYVFSIVQSVMRKECMNPDNLEKVKEGLVTEQKIIELDKDLDQLIKSLEQVKRVVRTG